MILESLDKHDQEEAQSKSELIGGIGADRNAQESEVSERIGVDQSESGAQSSGVGMGGAGGSGGVPTGGGVGVPLIGAGGAGGQEAVGSQSGGGLPTKSMGVVDWAKVIDGYRQSQRAEAAQGSDGAQGSELSGDSGSSESSSSSASSGSSGSSGGSVSLEPMDAVEVARERKARAVERVVEGLRDETFYNALMRGVEDPREVQRKREAYRRKGAAWRSMVSLADMVANAIDAYGADRNAYTLDRGLGSARYDQMLARELSRLDSEYGLAEGLERDALGKMKGREDRARAVELQEAREALAGAEAERAARARAQAERAKAEEEKKYRADRDKVKDAQWEREFKDRAEDRKARRGVQARRLALQARGVNGGGGSKRGAGRGSGGRRVFFDVGGKNRWTHELRVPEGSEKEFRESAIKYGRSNANWLIKNNPVYVRTYAEQMGLPTGGASTSDLLRMVRKEGNMDDLYAGLATTSRGFLLSRSVAYGDGEALARVIEETVSPVRGAVVRGVKLSSGEDLAKKVAKAIKVDAEMCDVSVGEMYQVYESEMYAGVGKDGVGRVDKFMDDVDNYLGQ